MRPPAIALNNTCELVGRRHRDWECNPTLTAAMIRAFAVSDVTADAKSTSTGGDSLRARAAKAISGGEPTAQDYQIVHFIGDV
ncbi:hypothetical protein [Mycolicibacterium gadium]|uniref:hypothetical protein n=1 Tax=Mycolicibacterium gadium TaxID=1794 RepID=UPI002FDDECD9